MLDTTTAHTFPQFAQNVVLTEAAQTVAFINDKHREVQRLGRTAKDFAAEIGEKLIAVKDDLKHGEFMPWVEANCSFSDRHARRYMAVAEVKRTRMSDFARCESIADVLALGKPKPEPKPTHRAATLDDLRKVERLRALRDDPSAPIGERQAAQKKIDKIEAEIGKVEPQAEAKAKVKAKAKPKTRHDVRLRACAVMDKVAPTLTGNPRSMIISAIMIAYGDTPEKIEEILEALKGNA